MNPIVFQLILPSYLVAGVVALVWKRHVVVRRTGRDPVRAQDRAGRDSAAGFAQSVLVLATSALALDVLMRALWPSQIEALLTLPRLGGATLFRWSGLALMSLGLLLYFIGLVGLGDAWRIGIDSERPGPLVTGGVFAHVRHPLYTGILMATLGMAVLTSDALSICAAAAAWTAVPIQARLEEEFLAGQYPEYGAYRSRTGRFVPRWS
jgi:protein-S-isoprenylcysteine O-methyltransferase Ste14